MSIYAMESETCPCIVKEDTKRSHEVEKHKKMCAFNPAIKGCFSCRHFFERENKEPDCKKGQYVDDDLIAGGQCVFWRGI